MAGNATDLTAQIGASVAALAVSRISALLAAPATAAAQIGSATA
ncbi:hypothetical protein AB0L05_28755 [Nonomuraea pusilla]